MISLFKIENLKTYLIVAAIIAAVVFYMDYSHQKAENKRQTANMESLLSQEREKYTKLVLSNNELEKYLEANRRDLQDFIKENDIRYRRIEAIVTQRLNYRDTTPREVDLQPILDAIKRNQDIRVPVADSTDCLVVSGFVAFENDTLKLEINNRVFKSISDVISYWERNQWSFLGIKTRLFGRKVATVIATDSCGNTETFVVEKRK